VALDWMTPDNGLAPRPIQKARAREPTKSDRLNWSRSR